MKNVPALLLLLFTHILLNAQVTARPNMSTVRLATPDKSVITTVENIESLRELSGKPGQVVYLKYHTNANDGGGGHFMWRTSPQFLDANNYFSHDNNGTLILANRTNSGRWVRQYEGYISTAYFGANISNATQSIQNAIDFAWHNQDQNAPTKGCTVFIPAGTYITDKLTLRNGVQLLGDSHDQTFILPRLPQEGGKEGGYLFEIDEGVLQISVSNLSILGRNIHKGCFHFKAALSASSPNQGGLWFSYFNKIKIAGFAGHAIFLEGGEGGMLPNQFIVFELLSIEMSPESPADANALKITGQQGQLTFINTAFNGYNNNMSFHTGHVVDISHSNDYYSAVISFINASFQQGDYGLYLDYAENVTVENCWFENLGVAVTVDGTYHSCQGINITGNRFANAAGYGSLNVSTNNILHGKCIDVINSHVSVTNNYVAVSELTNTSSDDYFITAKGLNGAINPGIEAYGNSYAYPELGGTMGITQTITVSSNTINCGYNKVMLIDNAYLPVTTITSSLNAGETLFIKAINGTITFKTGTITLLPHVASLVLNKGEAATFIKLDNENGSATYHLMSVLK